MSETNRLKILASLDKDSANALLWDWNFWGRSNQLEPDGNWWHTWLPLAGRGWGKTRVGAEWIRAKVCGGTPLSAGQYSRVALIAETAADARNVMVEGQSGLLSVHPPEYRPLYEPSRRRLTWPNGAIATTYNAIEPDQLRGPQHDAAWCDELAKWRYGQETWDNLQFGLRIGMHPRQIVTTTPKPIKLLKLIMEDPYTVVTRGSTYENRPNLAPAFFKTIISRYEGTRVGRQELLAEFLEEAEGALWSLEMIEANRVAHPPDMRQIVVAIDPAVTSKQQSDETGILVCGLGVDNHGYVLDDLSGRYTPDGWARRALKAQDLHDADRLVAEINNGGEMVEFTLRTTAKAMRDAGERESAEISYKSVHASRGKQARAEPIAALDEQGRIHHVGGFSDLETQMVTWEPLSGDRSPDRIDARVWGFTELMLKREAGGPKVW